MLDADNDDEDDDDEGEWADEVGDALTMMMMMVVVLVLLLLLLLLMMMMMMMMMMIMMVVVLMASMVTMRSAILVELRQLPDGSEDGCFVFPRRFAELQPGFGHLLGKKDKMLGGAFATVNFASSRPQMRPARMESSTRTLRWRRPKRVNQLQPG